jgi:hypothetical protein
MRRFQVPRSDVIAGIEWLGEQVPYPVKEVKGDTYPMTWAADGEIYASSGDPNWGESPWGLDVEKIIGYPPDYHIEQVNPMVHFTGWGGWGPKPTGMISVKGVLYLAVQNCGGKKPPVYGTKSQNGTDAHIFASKDLHLKAIDRYLLLTWRLNEDFSPSAGSRLIVYDAPEPWGPFTLAHYEPQWQSQEMNPYCPRIPLKWMEPDGLTGWLQFSGSWGSQDAHYRSHVQRFRIRPAR